ncbi:MAG: FecR domain-containing protein [Acidobacteriota bacterium]|nr:FecR domain-containing protein [Acidobacteriota bacterium]
MPAQTVVAGPGRVVGITGNLSVRHANLAARAVALNETVGVGDELVTDAQSEATIQTNDGGTVHVYPDSRVIFNDPAFGVTEFLHLVFGSIKVHIEKLSGRPNPHSMTTPTAVIAVRGTTFSVFVDDTDATLVAVDEGLVAVSNRASPASEVLLRAGQRSWVRGSLPPLRAQAFRGRSEHADMTAGMMRGMAGNGMSGAMSGEMGSALSNGRMTGMAGMSGRAGPPH